MWMTWGVEPIVLEIFRRLTLKERDPPAKFGSRR
jgi:hypothetical protein